MSKFEEKFCKSFAKVDPKTVIEMCDNTIKLVLATQSRENDRMIEKQRVKMEEYRNRWYRRMLRKKHVFVPVSTEEAKSEIEEESEEEDFHDYPSCRSDLFRGIAEKIKQLAQSNPISLYLTVDDWKAIGG